MSACGICQGRGTIRSVRFVQNDKGEQVEVVEEIPCTACPK